jgi:zinc D-Ala-D-Ala carboxypeptidase
MKHFNLSEFFCSSTAAKNGIKNEPSPDEKATIVRNINLLVDNVLDPIRDKLCTPVVITSGYRCPQVNKLVGGANNSQHMSGCAADFHVKGFTRSMMYNVFFGIYYAIDFDQIIYYRNKNIIHISYVGNGNRHEAFIKK